MTGLGAALLTDAEWAAAWALSLGLAWIVERVARRVRMRRLCRAKARTVAARNADVEARFAAGRDQLLAAVRSPEALRPTGGES